jgi:DNA-binding PadR family transcriptional regulator
LGQKQASGQLHIAVRRLLADELIKMTIPDKPKSRLQRYRLTDKGRAWLRSRLGEDRNDARTPGRSRLRHSNPKRR